MGINHVLYNPKACNGHGLDNANRLIQIIHDQELIFTDMTTIEDFNSYISSLENDDTVILCGGDGTINYFVNHISDTEISNKLFYFPSGTGNDFYHDISKNVTANLIQINDYIRDLPIVTVNGKDYRFLNNVGFGIDGYCCQVGDEMRSQGKENINYTAIAIKGMLGGFRPVTATVTVDGHTEKFKKVWLAPTMKGRFYGGGMMPTPGQDRLANDHRVSLMVFHARGKLKTLAIFPSIFQGEHIHHTRMVKVFVGSETKVTFNKPCALQIDGETILNVTEYSVRTKE